MRFGSPAAFLGDPHMRLGRGNKLIYFLVFRGVGVLKGSKAPKGVLALILREKMCAEGMRRIGSSEAYKMCPG